MRMLSDLVKRIAVPTMKALAFGSVCYAGFAYHSSRAGLRGGSPNSTFTLWAVFTVGCVLSVHDVRHLK
jgi:hypothetical protein